MPAQRSTLTERQQKWFASVKSGLERDTGKTLEEWVKIARTCPETAPRARTLWLKEKHGLGVNRAATILDAAFGSIGWDDPGALKDALWADETLRAIYERIEAAALRLEGVTLGPRKGYTAFSRAFQFAAARPHKGGVRLGLAVPPDAEPRLEPAKPKEGWSERLKSVAMLMKPADFDARLKSLLKAAWEAS
ncbi:MAG: DUF4287 domain-containing protein [Parvularculaceae bacterium]|nr:DUF4287 domain-containing protein [Parvularculaceae bacterium]